MCFFLLARLSFRLGDHCRYPDFRDLKTSFSIRALCFSVLIVCAFLVGWILPPPTSDYALSPVVIAVRDVPYGTTIQRDDVRTVYRRNHEIPDLAATDLAQTYGFRAQYKIRNNSFIFLDQIISPKGLSIQIRAPAGKKLVYIPLETPVDPLAWQLLSEHDVVSIYSVDVDSDDTTRTCLIPNCTVYSKSNLSDSNMIGVWLTQNEANMVFDAQKNKRQIKIDRPK